MRQRTYEMDIVFLHTTEFFSAYYQHQLFKKNGIPAPDRLARERVNVECACAFYVVAKRRIER